jgi:hypothetical protein
MISLMGLCAAFVLNQVGTEISTSAERFEQKTHEKIEWWEKLLAFIIFLPLLWGEVWLISRILVMLGFK